MKAKHRRTLCPCVHGIEHHPDRGPCTYGAGTVFGGCRCPAFGTPKSRQPSGPIDIDEAEIDSKVRFVNAALDALASSMKEILRRRREAIASGDVDDRVVLAGDRRHGKTARMRAGSIVATANGHVVGIVGKPTDSFEVVREAKPVGITVPSRRQEGVAYVTTRDPGMSGVLATTTTSALKPIAVLFLTVLAQHLGPLTRKQILLFANRKATGDAGVAFADILRRGFAKNVGDGLAITELGKRVVGNVDPLPTGAALRLQLIEQSDPFTSLVLEELFDIYPRALTRAELLACTGYRKSGDCSVAFARMVTAGYAVKVGKTGIAAAPELFA